MSRRWWAPALLALIASMPAPVAAQPGVPPPRNTHTRARAGADTMLTLDNVRLLVPAGAVAGGAMVGLGTGGVPAEGRMNTTGIVVTAAGGLREQVAVLIAVTRADRAAAGTEPALVDVVDGHATPCLDTGSWISCPVRRAGAYVVGRTAGPAPSDALLTRSLQDAFPDEGSGRPSVLVIAAIVGLAATAGALAARLLGGRRAEV